MKTLKFILSLLMLVTLNSCTDNTSDTQLDLSNENIAGIYNISSLNIDTETSATTSGITVTVLNTSSTGDTFQVEFIFNEDGTYMLSGQLRIVSTITPIGESPVTDEEIIVVNDAGTYSINATDNTISFMTQDNAFVEGTFNVSVFNNTTVSLNQQVEETMGELSSDINMNVSLERQ
tara:strand:- start:61250 stop:61780 length:531 start_codon:yes stop_codon:yes gene_type:complete